MIVVYLLLLGPLPIYFLHGLLHLGVRTLIFEIVPPHILNRVKIAYVFRLIVGDDFVESDLFKVFLPLVHQSPIGLINLPLRVYVLEGSHPIAAIRQALRIHQHRRAVLVQLIQPGNHMV